VFGRAQVKHHREHDHIRAKAERPEDEEEEEEDPCGEARRRRAPHELEEPEDVVCAVVLHLPRERDEEEGKGEPLDEGNHPSGVAADLKVERCIFVRAAEGDEEKRRRRKLAKA